MSTAYSSAKQQYIGNGVTTEWGFDFPIKKHSELKVYLKRSVLTQVLLEEGVDYSFVTDNTITFPIKAGEAKLQASDVLALQRESVFESEYNFSNQQRLEPEEVMHADDNLERQIQELKRDVTQAIRIQPTSNINTDEYFVAVESIYENLDNINNVSGISSEIVNCSDNISDITTVSSNIENVNTVAQSISNVNTVANNISDVNTAALNIEAIKDAPNQANAASQSASDASQYATNAANSATASANSATDSANSATASATSAQAAQDALNDVQGLIATPIGTIFQSVYVDESIDIARQLNGQLISSTKFTGFRQWLNTVQTATPSLFTTETNWQSEKTNSKLGQCGKFVIDDTAGTIRLPCVVNAQGLVDLALIGGIKSESLPNISGDVNIPVYAQWVTITNGPFTKSNYGSTIDNGGDEFFQDSLLLHFNASRVSSTYQDNAPVQQEAVQYPYYIQVATGVEETLPAIREYNINTPFFFGQSMYSDVAPDNASWLVSNGQYNAKTVYPSCYNWLLENVNKGVKGFWGQTAYAYGDANGVTYLTTNAPQVGSVCYNMSYQRSGYIEAVYSDGSVKIRDDFGNASYDNIHYYPAGNISSTSFITDHDWVVNTSDETFRLPLKSKLASGSLVVGNGLALGLTNGTTNYGLTTPDGAGPRLNGITGAYGSPVSTTGGGAGIGQNNILGVTTNPTKSGIETSSNGLKLYYYVGDTVQDASLINAGAVLGQLASVNAASRGYVVESYHNGTEWYRIYSDGWIEQGGLGPANSGNKTITLYKPYSNANYTIIQTPYSGSGAGSYSSAIKSQTNTSFVLAVESAYGKGFYWQACGY